MSSSCYEQRRAVLECLADSPCTAAGRSAKQCMDEDVSCKALCSALFLCKRGQLDMRKRIKGNLPEDSEPTESPETIEVSR